MKRYLLVGSSVLLALLLTGCAARTDGRDACANEVDGAWRELSLAEAEGFAGAVSYSKALALITTAKTQQQLENYASCSQQAKRARFYIRESRAGR